MLYTKKGKKDQGGQVIGETNKARVIHPWRTELKEFLQKNLVDANYPPLYRICDYCRFTKETVILDMDRKNYQTILVTGRCVFGKCCKFNHRTATKKTLACINETLNWFVSDLLKITGEKNIIT